MSKPEIVISRPSQELTEQERRTLEACEIDFAKGLKLQIDALEVIRDKRLYRAEFDTFDEYLQDRVGKSRHWVNRQINYFQVCANLMDSGLVPIGTKMTESATREIAHLPQPEQVEIVAEVVSEGKMPTAKNLKAATEKKKNTAVSSAFEEIEAERGEVEEEPTPPKQPSGKGSTKEQNPAILVDELTRNFVSPLVRGVDNVASVNGGKGPKHEQANDSLNGLIDALKGMRKGER